VAGDEPPLRARLSHDQQPTDAHRLPAMLASQERGDDAPLSRHRGMQILNVGDPALDFHEHERPMSWLPPNEVDRSPIAEVIERVLHEDLPAMAAHDRGHGIDEGGVLDVEQTGQLTAAPLRLDENANLKRATDRPQPGDRQALQLPSLGKRDQLLADAGSVCHVLLSPLKPAPNRPKN
jgi:hypothetical protein